MAKSKNFSREQSKSKTSPFRDYWAKNNYFIILIGLGLLAIGYYLMSSNPWDNLTSLTISPIVLIVAYVIIIPLSIFIRPITKKKITE
ncbi:MAG: hypothetical protein HYS25_09965 [Ignavibacteriales bacterium]|nr:hypothetical protein [Ignavibacteriales bacterium]